MFDYYTIATGREIAGPWDLKISLREPGFWYIHFNKNIIYIFMSIFY